MVDQRLAEKFASQLLIIRSQDFRVRKALCKLIIGLNNGLTGRGLIGLCIKIFASLLFKHNCLLFTNSFHCTFWLNNDKLIQTFVSGVFEHEINECWLMLIISLCLTDRHSHHAEWCRYASGIVGGWSIMSSAIILSLNAGDEITLSVVQGTVVGFGYGSYIGFLL